MRDNDASADEAAVNFLKNNQDWTKWVPADVAERRQVRRSANEPIHGYGRRAGASTRRPVRA